MATKEQELGARPVGLTFRRYFTNDGVHPFDGVEWEIRDAVIPNYKEGGNAFEQREVIRHQAFEDVVVGKFNPYP